VHIESATTTATAPPAACIVSSWSIATPNWHRSPARSSPDPGERQRLTRTLVHSPHASVKARTHT
jgi:hypothetical protein